MKTIQETCDLIFLEESKPNDVFECLEEVSIGIDFLGKPIWHFKKGDKVTIANSSPERYSKEDFRISNKLKFIGNEKDK